MAKPDLREYLAFTRWVAQFSYDDVKKHRRVSAVRSGIRTWRRGYRFGDTFGGLALGPAGSTLRDVLGRFWADGEPERVEF
jgi:hypothetical protein